jgi:hypothetical protein
MNDIPVPLKKQHPNRLLNRRIRRKKAVLFLEKLLEFDAEIPVAKFWERR